jgi:hypothetical protein
MTARPYERDSEMPQYIDTEGRTWTVQINIATVKAVRSACGVDLLQAVEWKLTEELIADPVKLVDILFVICQAQAEKQGVSDEQFGRALFGDPLAEATSAFLGALVDFFPKDRRAVMAKAIEKRDILERKTLEVMSKQLDDPRIDEEFDKILSTRGNLSTNLRESLESIRDRSP